MIEKNLNEQVKIQEQRANMQRKTVLNLPSNELTLMEEAILSKRFNYPVTVNKVHVIDFSMETSTK